MSPRMMFEQELVQLKDKVAEMGSYAQVGYDRLMVAMLGNDYGTINELQENDGKIVDMQRSIEADCLRLMTKQQPVARDLRLVSAALKVVSDMERIGDHVIDIAELLMRRYKEDMQPSLGATLVSMFHEAAKMLSESVDAFLDGDVELANAVIEMDDIVDDHFNRVKEEMMEAIRNQALDADRVVDNLMVAKYLEKMGDHAVNIAKWSVFRMTGDMEGNTLY